MPIRLAYVRPITLRCMSPRLGDEIRQAREALGLTQAQLAERVGVARETVGNWETGTSTPRNKLGRLREVLSAPLGAATVGTAPDAAAVDVLLDLPAELTEGLTEMEREELRQHLKAQAFTKAAEIRRRADG